MQTSQRHAGPGVIRRLFDAPWRFQFVQAMRVLDCWLGRPDPSRLNPRIHFCNRVSLSFPQSEIDAIAIDARMPIDTDEQLEQARQEGDIVRVCVTPAFLSLLGSTGQMPYTFTRRVLGAQSISRMEGVRAFFDFLSQRAFELFYQACAQARVYYAADAQGRDGFLPIGLAIAGVSPARKRLASIDGEALVADEAAVYYAAILRRQSTSAEALQGLLTDYFGLPFQVQPFATEWYWLRPEERSVLGGGNCVLGQGITLGSRQQVRGRRVRLRIGPMSRADFEYFLPHAEGARALAAFLRLFRLDSMPFEVQLVLRAQDMQPEVLGTGQQLGHGHYLGRGAPAGDFDRYRYELALI